MPSDLIIFLFVVLGICSGLLGGLLGIGGGVVTVPILYFIFHYAGILEERVMQVAVATSLAGSVVTALVSSLLQWRKKAVVFRAVRWMLPGLFVGSILGSVIVLYLSSALLGHIFGALAIALGIYFFFPRLPALPISSSPNPTLGFFGFFIGTLSSLLGIGGGSLTFPVLLGYKIPAKNASATSSVSTLVTTFLGSVTYLIIARNRPGLPDTFGYIEIPAFISISLGSLISTPLGVKLSHILNTSFIKQIFGCSLSLIGLLMFFF